MAWQWAIAAARHIPWKTLMAQAPQIAAAAQQLYEANQKRGAHAPDAASAEGLEDELRRLRAENAEQLRVIEALAREVQGLAASVAALRARIWIAGGVAGLALLLAVAALWVVVA